MAFLRLDRRAIFKRAVFGFPFEQAAVEHGHIIVAEDLEHPPDAGRGKQADAVVADHLLAIADAHLADVAGKFFRLGQHVGQGAFGIGNQVDVEELGAGNAGCEELRLGIALGGGHVP